NLVAAQLRFDAQILPEARLRGDERTEGLLRGWGRHGGVPQEARLNDKVPPPAPLVSPITEVAERRDAEIVLPHPSAFYAIFSYFSVWVAVLDSGGSFR